MTNEEREKLIVDMAQAIAVAVDPDDAARAALAIAEAAFAKQIEAAYKEGWCDNSLDDQYDWDFEYAWKASETKTILASIPEPKP